MGLRRIFEALEATSFDVRSFFAMVITSFLGDRGRVMGWIGDCGVLADFSGREAQNFEPRISRINTNGPEGRQPTVV